MNTEIIDARLTLLKAWVHEQLNTSIIEIKPLFGDCSFRRYFRVLVPHASYILMDAPPDKEPCDAFVAVAAAFRKQGLLTPAVYASDVSRGFLLLSDFGDRLLLQALQTNTADFFYRECFSEIVKIQKCKNIENYVLPRFDMTLYAKEFDLFVTWYLEKFLQADLSHLEKQRLVRVFTALSDMGLAQPQVCVHRDFHARNILVLTNAQTQEQSLGILDFQDAVWGPISYDLVSLLRDCYIDWPLKQVEQWVMQFQQKLLQQGFLAVNQQQQFLLWFDWMGLQRHLKCLGIFSRMGLLYGKPEYFSFIPRVLNYVLAVCEKYAEFSDLREILEKFKGDA